MFSKISFSFVYGIIKGTIDKIAPEPPPPHPSILAQGEILYLQGQLTRAIETYEAAKGENFLIAS